MSWKITPGWSPADADAAAYINAVETADSQALENGVKVAIDNFVLGCKADGIWSAIKASCILAGARTLNGALVPLVGTAPTNVNFVSGDYNRKTGLVGNGSTKYLNSNRNQNADPRNNQHLTAYLSSNSGTGNFVAARAEASNGFGDSSISSAPSANFPFRSRISAFNAAEQGSRSGATATGFVGLSRSSSASFTTRISGSNETLTATSATITSGNYGVFARIRTDTSTVDGYTASRLAFYSIGESLDLAKLDTRVTDLINAFAAAIP